MNSKQKGARGEREFAALCRAEGYQVRRTAQYCGNTTFDTIGARRCTTPRIDRLDFIRDGKQYGSGPTVRFTAIASNETIGSKKAADQAAIDNLRRRV